MLMGYKRTRDMLKKFLCCPYHTLRTHTGSVCIRNGSSSRGSEDISQ